MTVRWEPQATDDARDIWRYIAADDEYHANAWFDRLLDKIDTLEANPAIGQSRFDILTDLRSVPMGNYVVFYRAISDGIELLRVLHGARDIAAEFVRD